MSVCQQCENPASVQPQNADPEVPPKDEPYSCFEVQEVFRVLLIVVVIAAVSAHLYFSTITENRYPKYLELLPAVFVLRKIYKAFRRRYLRARLQRQDEMWDLEEQKPEKAEHRDTNDCKDGKDEGALDSEKDKMAIEVSSTEELIVKA